MLQAENVTLKMCGMFYEMTIQAMLLYGSETWSLSPLSMKCFEGFHIPATWQMSGKRPEWNVDRSRTYPCSEEVLEAVRMKLIVYYMDV